MNIIEDLKNEITETKEKLRKRRRKHVRLNIPTYFAILALFVVLTVLRYHDWSYTPISERHSEYIWYNWEFYLGWICCVPLLIYGSIMSVITLIRIIPLRITVKRKEREYKELSLEVVRKQKFTQPAEITVQPTKIRHITCRYCGYATPEDMIKCQHCGAAI